MTANPDIVLINPSGRHEIYQGLGDSIAAVEPPLWVRLIAGYLVDRGHYVKIIDADAEGLTYEQVGYLVAEMQPRYVGMVVYGHQPSASTQQMLPAQKTCSQIMGKSTAPIVIMGGHVSALPELTLKTTAVDYVAVGEGAVTLDLLLNGVPHENVPGLGYIGESGYVQNNPPPNLTCEELHGDVWHMLPMDKYRSHNWQSDDRQPYASIYTSLGCPFKCNFCCINAPFGGPGYRVRSPEDVVAEIQDLHDRYGVRTFKIIDEMFVLKPSHYIPICEALADLKLNINIWAYARIDTVKEDKLDLLYRAGIRWLALGIESADEVVRDGAEKSMSQDDIYQVVKDIQLSGIKVIGNFIFGLPHDTMETMYQTLSMAERLKCNFANFYSAMPYPGSKLFDTADTEDLPRSWSGYSQHSVDCKPLRNAQLSAKEILAFRDWAHRTYFKDSPELSTPLKRNLLDE